MGFLGTGQQTTMTTFGVYRHKTKTRAFGPGCCNKSADVTAAMSNSCSRLQMGLQQSGVETGSILIPTIQKLERFSKRIQHLYITNTHGTGFITHTGMIVISTTMTHSNAINLLSTIGQSHNPPCRRDG